MIEFSSSIDCKKIIEFNYEHVFYYPTPCKIEGHLRVSSLYNLYYATYGNPEGIPVIVLHGGPGAGCQESFLKVFDPNRYYIIMYDQRGSMRSTPLGCLEENTPQHSVEDIELIRKHLNIEQWLIFGGSWGVALGMLYGQTYPQYCLGFILRGVFLARKQDYLHLFYGTGKIFPEAYDELIRFIPKDEQDNLLEAYYRRVMNPDPTIFMEAARHFMKFDLICGSHCPEPTKVERFLKNDEFILGVSRLFLHYAMNQFFLNDNQLLSHVDRICHLPCMIVHGRWDAICLPEAAYTLHKSWENSFLWFVSQGGHSSNDLYIASALAYAADYFASHFHLNKKELVTY